MKSLLCHHRGWGRPGDPLAVAPSQLRQAPSLGWDSGHGQVPPALWPCVEGAPWLPCCLLFLWCCHPAATSALLGLGVTAGSCWGQATRASPTRPGQGVVPWTRGRRQQLSTDLPRGAQPGPCPCSSGGIGSHQPGDQHTDSAKHQNRKSLE